MRDCCDVILKMIKKIPDSEVDLLRDLQWNYEDACFKAPEETLQWRRTQATLIKHIPTPVTDWEFEVLSIFTTRPVWELKRLV